MSKKRVDYRTHQGYESDLLGIVKRLTEQSP